MFVQVCVDYVWAISKILKTAHVFSLYSEPQQIHCLHPEGSSYNTGSLFGDGENHHMAQPNMGHYSYKTRRVPVEEKASVCLICMKYRIIILIIIIISLGQILLSYIANTSRTHACARTLAHACACKHTHTPPSPPCRLALFVGAQPRRPAPLAFIAGSRVIQINTRAGHPIFQRFWNCFAYKENC